MADRVEVQMSGLTGVLELLQKLPPELVSKRGGPVKAALRKGAMVIHKQARANLEATLGYQQGEDVVQSTKLLMQNLVVTRGKAPSVGKGERYLVRVRRKAYPDRKGKPVTTLKTAQLKEYGSNLQTAEPWLRPAFQAKAAEAIRATEAELLKRLNAIVRKLSRGGAR